MYRDYNYIIERMQGDDFDSEFQKRVAEVHNLANNMKAEIDRKMEEFSRNLKRHSKLVQN